MAKYSIFRMKRYLSAFMGWLLGVPLLLIGVIILVIDKVAGQNTNILLFAGLTCVIAGIAGYVWRMKRTSRY